MLGRDRECEQIEAALDSARAGSAAVIAIFGEPGIGKTTLLDHAVQQANELNVVRIRAVESESEVAFAGLADACRPLLDFVGSLPPRQADALRRALALGSSTEGLDLDRLAVGAATLGLLAAGASAQPLLLIVDDADWLDGESAAALLFATRRIDAEPIAVIVAGRSLETFAGHGFDELHLQGLGHADSRELLAGAGCTPDVAERLVQATRGNPLALVELPRTLTAGQLRGDEQLGEPVQVGPGVERAFAHRVTLLGPEAQGALLVAAASDTNALIPVARAIERLGLPGEALEPAEAEGFLRLEGPVFEFRHPLLRSAVYHGATASERRRAHRALAEALAESDSERAAWHRAAAALAPDEEAAALLKAVAARAAARGAYSSSAAAYERAAWLGDEKSRIERLALAADAAWLGGDSPKAAALVGDGLAGDPPAPLRADLIALRARLELHSGDQQRAYRWFVEAADLVEASAPARAAAMLAEAVLAGSQFGGPELEQAAERLERLPHGNDPVLELVLRQALGTAASMRGTEESIDSVHGSEATLDDVARVATSPLDLYWACRGYYMLGRNAEASRLAREAIGRARDGQASGLLPQLLRLRAAADYDRGEWMTARAAAAEAADLAEELGQTTTACASLGLLAELESAIGADDDCREHAGRAIAIAANAGLGFYRERAERALARLEFTRGRLDAAAEQFKEIADRLDRDQNRELNVTPLADLVEVDTRRGDLDGAERALERLLALGESAMAGEEAVVARCRGLLAPDGNYAASFEHALDRHAADLFPFERARTALCYGERLRRGGERKAAREQLHAAAATFGSLGAVPWLERAHDELRASGGRLRAADEPDAERLTPRETQIAAQVAEGKSNREVGAALYLTAKTVEFHLTRIYRKLGIRSRSELVRLMSQ